MRITILVLDYQASVVMLREIRILCVQDSVLGIFYEFRARPFWEIGHKSNLLIVKSTLH